MTATKRTESVQDISIAVTPLSEDRIRNAGIRNIEDVQYYVPGLVVTKRFGLTKVFLRGLGNNTSDESIDPSVPIYVDGALLSPRGGQGFSFFDLERIEVLRGPQGTLYGRNSTGGAVNLITAKPTKEFEAYARAGAGNYRLAETEGALSGPLSDRLQGRFAWNTLSRDGFGENTVTGNDIDDENARSLRTSLALQAAESVDFLVIGEYARSDSAQTGAGHAKRPTFQGIPSLAALGLGGFAEDPRDIASEFDPDSDRETWSLSGIFDWRINDVLSVKNTFNYRELDTRMFQDFDYSSVVNRTDVTGNPTTNLEYLTSTEQVSEELQFTYQDEVFDRNFDSVFGFFYFEEDIFNGTEVGLTPTSGVDGPKRVLFFGEGALEAWAAYWNATYDITERVTLKLGGRFSDETRSIDNLAIVRVAGGLGPQITLPRESDVGEFDEYTPEVGLEWRPTDNLLLYYTYSEGFQAGSGGLATTGASVVGPESIQNNEFGVKTSWLAGRIVLNVAGYSYDMDDTQLRFGFPSGAGGFVTTIDNVEGIEAHGIEVDTLWAVTDRFALSGSGAWTHARYKPFKAINQASPDQFLLDPTSPLFDPTATFDDVAEDIGGNQTRGIPEWQWTVHGEYAVPMANGGTVTAFTDISYKSEIFFDAFNTPFLSEDSYSVIDARIRYTAPDEQWTMELWGKNLTDEFIEVNNIASAIGLMTSRTLLPPLTWGATFGFRF